MFTDRVNAQRLARDLIAEIASQWEPTDTSRFITLDGYHVLRFVIEPSRYTRLVRGPQDESPSADSTVCFNPFSEATQIVLDTAQGTDALRATGIINDAERDYLVKRDARARIRQMLGVARELFKDAMWQASIIGGTIHGVREMEYAGRPDLGRQIIKSSLVAIQERINKRMPMVSKTKNPKINRASIGSALEKFLIRFKETGALPSQRQFALAIGVTPKAWRSFLANHYLDKHEVTIKQWYAFLAAKESHTDDFPFLP